MVNYSRYSLDSVLGGKVRLRQAQDGYRVAIDTVLLAAAVPACAGERALEFGAGSAAAALCLAVRVPDCSIVGLERDPQLLALAEHNVELNGRRDRISLLQADVADVSEGVAAGGFDHVFANPPYLEAARADLRTPPDDQKLAAHFESDVPLAGWIDAMIASLREKGRITLIQRADRLTGILTALDGRVGELVVCPLWPKQGHPAKRVIVTGRRGVVTPLRIAAGLVLHEEDGSYTMAAKAILEQGEALIP